MSSSIRSLKTPSWLNEFRAFIMRSVANENRELTPIFPLTSTHRKSRATCRWSRTTIRGEPLLLRFCSITKRRCCEEQAGAYPTVVSVSIPSSTIR
jgi:hypothetical protein